MSIAGALLLLAFCLWLIWQSRHTKSLAQEKRELLEYFRKKDREERHQ